MKHINSLLSRRLISHQLRQQSRYLQTRIPHHILQSKQPLTTTESRSPRLLLSSSSSLSFHTSPIISSSNNAASSPIVTVTKSSESQPQQPITITPSCAHRIQQLSKTKYDNNPVHLRVYVDAGGCSGFQYKFEIEPTSSETIDHQDDIVITNEREGGGSVVVDRTSLEYIKGSMIDFEQEIIRSGFAVVNNPQSESACGCGSSFAVKNFAANPATD